MLTEKGRATAKLVADYGLINFYQYEVGNLIINPHEMTIEVVNRIMKFLKANENWVMGAEDDGDGCVAYYITEIDFLADCNGYTRR